jgi:hypothetical protein
MCSSRTLRAMGLYVGLPLRDERTCSVCGSNDANEPTRTFDGLGLCRKSAYVPVEHIGGRIDMKRHEFIRLIGGAGGGLAHYRALIAEWKDSKCWSALSAD